MAIIILILWISGISFISISIYEDQSWLALGCILGGIILLLSLGFSIIFWHFGKVREERKIVDYQFQVYNKKIPKEIEVKLELAKIKQLKKEEEMKNTANYKYDKKDLVRELTLESVQTCQTDVPSVPGSRVNSNDTAPPSEIFANFNFEGVSQGLSNLAFEGGSFQGSETSRR